MRCAVCGVLRAVYCPFGADEMDGAPYSNRHALHPLKLHLLSLRAQIVESVPLVAGEQCLGYEGMLTSA